VEDHPAIIALLLCVPEGSSLVFYGISILLLCACPAGSSLYL
jgi:hypothetical protein